MASRGIETKAGGLAHLKLMVINPSPIFCNLSCHVCYNMTTGYRRSTWNPYILHLFSLYFLFVFTRFLRALLHCKAASGPSLGLRPCMPPAVVAPSSFVVFLTCLALSHCLAAWPFMLGPQAPHAASRFHGTVISTRLHRNHSGQVHMEHHSDLRTLDLHKIPSAEASLPRVRPRCNLMPSDPLSSLLERGQRRVSYAGQRSPYAIASVYYSIPLLLLCLAASGPSRLGPWPRTPQPVPYMLTHLMAVHVSCDALPGGLGPFTSGPLAPHAAASSKDPTRFGSRSMQATPRPTRPTRAN